MNNKRSSPIDLPIDCNIKIELDLRDDILKHLDEFNRFHNKILLKKIKNLFKSSNKKMKTITTSESSEIDYLEISTCELNDLVSFLSELQGFHVLKKVPDQFNDDLNKSKDEIKMKLLKLKACKLEFENIYDLDVELNTESLLNGYHESNVKNKSNSPNATIGSNITTNVSNTTNLTNTANQKNATNKTNEAKSNSPNTKKTTKATKTTKKLDFVSAGSSSDESSDKSCASDDSYKPNEKNSSNDPPIKRPYRPRGCFC